MTEEGVWSKSRYLLTIKVVKAWFKFIEEDEDCREAGLKSFKKKMPVAGAFPRRDNIPSPQDLKAWKRAFRTGNMTGLRHWLVFCILLETGMRREELAVIEVQHLQLENRTIYIPDGKTGSRTVVITGSLVRIIQMYLKKRSRTKYGEGKYLLSTTKSPVPTGASITKFFSRLRKVKGLPYITPHTMRHAFCTYYIRNGGSTERLRNVTGHKTYTAMLHYLHLAKVGGAEQKEEIEKVSPLKMLDS
jgi:integrase